jgi:hypothetical protein
MIEKSDCTDCIAFGLNLTSNWRKKLAIKFSSDKRNAKASACLAVLATEAAGLSDSDWKRLQPHFGWASESFREAISVASRQVGFTHKIQDFPTFVDHLLDVLSQPVVAV